MSVSNLIDESIRSAWHRVLRLWKPMAWWSLLVLIFFAVLVSPLTSALLGLQLFRGDQLVVGNEALASWALSPAGIVYILLAGALAISGSVVHYGGLFQIISNDLQGRTHSLGNTVLYMAPRSPHLVKLCLFTVLAVLLLLIPLAALLLLVFTLFLGEYDINYYLIIKPPEWYYMLITGGILVIIWAVFVLWIVGRSLLVLPAYLYGNRTIIASLKRSWMLSRKKTWRLLRLLGTSAGLWILFQALVSAALLVITYQTLIRIESMFDSLQVFVLVTGFFLSVTLLIDIIIAFLGFSLVSTVLTKFYYEESGFQTRLHDGPGLRVLTTKTVTRLKLLLRPVRIAAITIILFGISLAASAVMLDRLPDTQAVTISAHRAGPPPEPENTLAALELAIDSGAEYSEIDVQLTRDGVPVILHDADLMRVAGDPRQIADVRFDEVKDLIQRPDGDSPPDERRLATLGEFLERARGRIGLMIELKYYGFDSRLAEVVIREIKKHQMENEVVVMSLNLDAVRQVQELAPGLTTGYLSAITLGNLSRLPVDFIAISRQSVTPSLVRSAKEQGIEVHVWTVNRPHDIANVIEMGVHGIITDDPGLAIQVRDELAAFTLAERILLQFRTFIVDSDNPATAQDEHL